MGHKIDLVEIAYAMHYAHATCVWTPEQLNEALENMYMDGPQLIEIRVKKGNRKDLGRPTTTPTQNKEAMMSFLKK